MQLEWFKNKDIKANLNLVINKSWTHQIETGNKLISSRKFKKVIGYSNKFND